MKRIEFYYKGDKMIIKKYKNRKMYSKVLKRYVNLEEIREIIEKGQNITVENHVGKDVTNEVLKQVLIKTEINTETLNDIIRGE